MPSSISASSLHCASGIASLAAASAISSTSGSSAVVELQGAVQAQAHHYLVGPSDGDLHHPFPPHGKHAAAAVAKCLSFNKATVPRKGSSTSSTRKTRHFDNGNRGVNAIAAASGEGK